MKTTLVNLTIFLLFISLAKGHSPYDENSEHDAKPSATNLPITKTSSGGNDNSRLDSGSLLNQDKMLSPLQDQNKEKEEDFGLVEVKESEIPEGTAVYVLEEPEDAPGNGEIMQTANNMVFRPLFRYRGRQEARRRNYNGYRRRYFVPRRPYRYAYWYPYNYYYY